MIDYPCAKFGDFSFSRFDFIVQTNTELQMPLNALLSPGRDCRRCE